MPTEIWHSSPFFFPPPAAIMRHMTVMVVDANADMRRMIRWVVSDLVEMVRECATPAEALDDYDTVRPDVIVMDLGVPPEDGLWATRRITAFDPQALVVIVAPYPDATFRQAAEQAGARHFVLKDNLIDLRRWLQTGTDITHR
jgi:DNA-binding NarL/FixJ family response regulator